MTVISSPRSPGSRDAYNNPPSEQPVATTNTTNTAMSASSPSDQDNARSDVSPTPSTPPQNGELNSGYRLNLPIHPDGTLFCDHESCRSNPPTFKRRCEWKKHNDKHERPYHCTVKGCKTKGFTYSGGLSRHMREVHKQDVEPAKLLFCPYKNCSRSAENGASHGFTRAENLKEHERRRHSRSDGALFPVSNGTPVASDANGRVKLAPAVAKQEPAPEKIQLQQIPTPRPLQPAWKEVQVHLQHSPNAPHLPPLKRKRDSETSLPSFAHLTGAPGAQNLLVTHPPIPTQMNSPSNASTRSIPDYVDDDDDGEDPREQIKRLRRDLKDEKKRLEWALDKIRRLETELSSNSTTLPSHHRHHSIGSYRGGASENGNGPTTAPIEHHHYQPRPSGFTPLTPYTQG